MKGPVVVAHHYWGYGGETEFNVSLVGELCRLGLKVRVAAVTRPPSGVLSRLQRRGCVDSVRVLVPASLGFAAVAQRLLLPAAIAKAAAGARLLWVDAPTYGPVAERLRRAGVAIVEYIHFPLEAADPRVSAGLPNDLSRDVEAYFSRYRRRLPWRVYMATYLSLQGLVARRDPFRDADAVVANSAYVARIVEALWGSRPEVLNPPVDVEAFSAGAGRGFNERLPEVVVLGRVSPEKRIEVVIAAAAASRSKPRVTVAGGVSAGARAYLARLARLARRLGVDLRILANPPRRAMAEAAWRARVYVHAAVGEHFGITVVEAMAAGLPVVVHRSGGPYWDIVEEGRWGMHYSTLQELAEAIDILVASRRDWAEYHERSLERAKKYTPRAFRSRLSGIMEALGASSGPLP